MDGDGIRVLVEDTRGVRGRAIARRLLADGVRVRVVIRDEATGERWRPAGAEVVTGDLADWASPERTGAGGDADFFHVPLFYDRPLGVGYGCNAIEAARASGVRHLVYLDNNVFPVEATDAAGFETDREVAADALERGVRSTVPGPTVFFDNLIGPWTARVWSTRGPRLSAPGRGDDLLARRGRCGSTRRRRARPTRSGGDQLRHRRPAGFTRDELAGRFAGVFGRPVRYSAIPLDAVEQGMTAAVGAQAGPEIAKLDRWDAARGDGRRGAVNLGLVLA